MKEELLAVLCEPVTGADLALLAREWRGDDVWAGSLRSALTRRRYPIRNGIPRFVRDEGHTGSFGLQWNRFARVQLDSATGASYSQQRFWNETGWSRADLRGKWLLDAGCGAGRFGEVAAAAGARVVALDRSSAVDAAARNLARFPNVHPVQADLLALPLRRGSLDLGVSIGVLQHTPRQGEAIAALLRVLTPDGKFALTIYARHWYLAFHGKYLLRHLTKRLPAGLLLASIVAAMPVLFPLTQRLYARPRLQRLARFAIPVANYVERTDLTREQRYAEAILDTFDMLAPAYDRPMTPREVRLILRRLRVADYRFRSEKPINVVGTAPGKRRPR